MKPAVLRCWRRHFGGLEQLLPCAFVRHVVEPLERPVLGGDELPQIDCPPLAGKIWRTSMTWITLTSFMFLSFMLLTHVWSPASSAESPQDRPFLSQEVSRMGALNRNSGAAAQLAGRLRKPAS